MKVAIVHDWLVTYAGGERVLEQLIRVYPNADLFAVCDFLPMEQRDFLGGREVKTTFIQNLPWARHKYRTYLPFMPIAIEQLDLSGYDIVISSSHAVAKGVLTGPDQLHISYVHSPMRYAWDLQHQYLRQAHLEHGLKSWLARYILHRMRVWDVRTTNGVDRFVANSNFIARRINKTYGRSAVVIYPPVDVDAFDVGDESEREDFYVTVSRIVPYKMVNIIVDAFRLMPKRRLVVIGDGPGLRQLQAYAGPNVTVLGRQSFDRLHEYVRRARALVFAAEEDFGIAPVEAQACGTPVIAYNRGGTCETVNDLGKSDAPTGVLFEKQTAESLARAVEHFERNELSFVRHNCRSNAERFSKDTFCRSFRALVDSVCDEMAH